MLHGTGILPNSSDYYIYSETFKLLPHSLGLTAVGLNKAHLILPSIGNILKTYEQALLQEHSNDLTTLQTTETVIQRATGRVARPGLDVVEISRTLQSITPGDTNHILPWLIGIIIALALLLLICVIHTKNTEGMRWSNWERMWNLHSTPKPEAVPMPKRD